MLWNIWEANYPSLPGTTGGARKGEGDGDEILLAAYGAGINSGRTVNFGIIGEFNRWALRAQ